MTDKSLLMGSYSNQNLNPAVARKMKQYIFLPRHPWAVKNLIRFDERSELKAKIDLVFQRI